MSEKPLSRRSVLITGSLSVGMGLFVIAISLNLIPVEDQSFNAPRWVGGVAGLIFVLGGVLVIIHQREQQRTLTGPRIASEVAQFLVAGLLITLFALIGNWIAFGPGDRQFSSAVSVPFITIFQSANEITGRVCFGMFAILLDGLALWVWASGLWRAIGFLQHSREINR